MSTITLSPAPATPSVWAPPRLSMRWWPVFLRNLLVWRKLALLSTLNAFFLVDKARVEAVLKGNDSQLRAIYNYYAKQVSVARAGTC